MSLFSCPCVNTTPCDPHCTCVVPVSSHGCRRCCSYGSEAQRRARAYQLVACGEALDDIMAAAYIFDDKPHQLFSAIRRAALSVETDGEMRDEIVRLMDVEYERDR